MDREQTPEEEANEQRTVKPERKRWSVIDTVEKAVTGLVKPMPDNDLNADEQEHLREENDAEQRR